MTRNLAGTRGQQQWQTAGTEQLISSVGRSEGSDEHHSSKDNLAAALGAALAAAGLASGAVAVALALHAAVVDSGSQKVQRLFGGPRRSYLSISGQPMRYF